ncbi:MAG: DUF2341 domain-containing protein [Betaproteobacteria bacterium]|nr:DUF2341 domain-containing protein [Betaproteobacteria bacterium]
MGRWLAILFEAVVLWFVTSSAAHAWWNDDWAFRNRVTVDAAATGATVLIRLHSGNFSFVDAREDGADLRVIAADDKTELPFQLESYDAVNELALVWVRVPAAAAGKPEFWLYGGNPKAAAPGKNSAAYDANTAGAFHFAESTGTPADATGNGMRASVARTESIVDGVVGRALRLRGGAAFEAVAAVASPDGAWTISFWMRLPRPESAATLLRWQAGGSVGAMAIEAGHLKAGTGGANLRGAQPLAAEKWHAVTWILGPEAVLLVDGVESGRGPAQALSGALTLRIGGEGLDVDIDELSVSAVARPLPWLAAVQASQGPGGRGVIVATSELRAAEGGGSYFKVLLGSVTVDGWVVIGVLAGMFVLSVGVILSKGVGLFRVQRANRRFMTGYRSRIDDMLEPELLESQWKALEDSPHYRLWRLALEEVQARKTRAARAGRSFSLPALSLAAIKTSLDSAATLEAERLNARMVLLTIAISGGPFLGLLGTVTGVMITFAAIAATGDVNINSIAPGIAAALVATVAGLAVAIPCLFAYNYFASRIRALVVRMNAFTDELATRLAERHGPTDGGDRA